LIWNGLPYRARRSFAEACAGIVRHRALQFDPAVVDAFVRIPGDDWQKL
jgi:HD-GYP domain-containing protein (c-di-GMP phosphodiesterase class II)